MLELLVTIATGEFGSREVLDAIEEAVDGGVEFDLIDAAIEALRETALGRIEDLEEAFEPIDSERFASWPGERTYRLVPWHNRLTHLETRDFWEE